MKSILIAHNYSEKSFSGMSYNLAHYLANKGYRVLFISYRPFFEKIEKIEVGKGEIIVFSWPTRKRPTSYKDMLWFVKVYLKYKPKLVISHFTSSNIVSIISKFFFIYNTKTFVYFHTIFKEFEDKSSRSLNFYLLTFRKALFYKFFCDVVVCPSSYGNEFLKKIFYYKKGVVILNPLVDRNDLKNNIENAISDKIIISYLGRLEIDKGVIDLVNAFKVYKNENSKTKIIVKIAGSGSEKDFIYEEAKNTKDIYFFDELPYADVDEYIKNSHYVIIPSKFDNLPTVGIESLMNGTPLLISYSTGLTEYLINEDECYKFYADSNSIIEILKKVENNFNDHQNMKNASRLAYENNFTINKYNQQMEYLIKKHIK